MRNSTERSTNILYWKTNIYQREFWWKNFVSGISYKIICAELTVKRSVSIQIPSFSLLACAKKKFELRQWDVIKRESTKFVLIYLFNCLNSYTLTNPMLSLRGFHLLRDFGFSIMALRYLLVLFVSKFLTAFFYTGFALSYAHLLFLMPAKRKFISWSAGIIIGITYYS